ncbi:MAG: diacylglycerol kinase family lipid kinase [Chloroflexota bacterium]|nr:diacylglycerol kinase family lipid kinase [Chloroflexota bacterium]
MDEDQADPQNLLEGGVPSAMLMGTDTPDGISDPALATPIMQNPRKRVKVIINPTSGKKGGITTNPAGAADVMAALGRAGIQADIFETRGPDDGTVLAMEAADEGYDMVVSCGGDGTTDEVAAGLIGSSMVLGIVPLGSANNVARMLHIPADVEGAVRLLQEGEVRCIDVGRIGETNGRVFLETAGIGMDAELFPLLNQLDRGAYMTLFEVLRTFLRARPHRMTLYMDRRRVRVRALMVLVANGPYWGYSIPLAPDAKVNDHRLDVVVFENFSKWEFLRHIVTAFFGRGKRINPHLGGTRNRRIYHPKQRYYRASKVRIISRRPIPVHGDARLVAHTPVTIQIQSNALSVVVGRGEHVSTDSD